MGLDPSRILVLRRMAASATGISMTSQRCLTSCNFVCYGMRSDPWQRVLKETALMWMKVMPKYFARSRHELALAWSKAKQALSHGPVPMQFDQILAMKIRWQNVVGLLSNVVACVFMCGWCLVSFSGWHAPNGDVWSLPTRHDHKICLVHMIRAMQDDVMHRHWHGASLHFALCSWRVRHPWAGAVAAAGVLPG